MSKFADLHMHTNCSDGTMSPKEAVIEANNQGLSCIAITDHDTFAGVSEAAEVGQECGVEVIAGVELSSEINNKDVHVLGYFKDCKSDSFKTALSKMQDTRVNRMQKMIDKLKLLGVDNITLEEVCALTNSDSVGRPHLAAILFKKKWVNSIRAAFDRFISEDGPAYVAKYKQTPSEAIKLIKDVGGVSVLAHPMLSGIDELIPGLVKDGLGGIEVYYPNISKAAVDYYKGIAEKNNLLLTGGSDAHGKAKDNTFIGKIKIPYDLVEALKNKMI